MSRMEREAADAVESARGLLRAACAELCATMAAHELDEDRAAVRAHLVATMDNVVTALTELSVAHDALVIARERAAG